MSAEFPTPAGTRDGGYTCTHCGRPAKGSAHTEGDQRGLQRCDPDDSGLVYGYNAHPLGTPCQIPCRGARGEGQ